MAIDIKLTSAYNNYVSPHDRSPGKVDTKEARELIQIADEMNDGSGCCGSRGKRGDKHLKRLVKENGDKFETEGRNLIAYWLKKHQLPEVSSDGQSCDKFSKEEKKIN